jgi:DNA-binding winged helix-turn-helix (wHTH) protein
LLPTPSLSVVQFGEFELDEARFELRRRGVAVAVQPKVLRMLLHLVAQRERAVGNSELFAVLWPGEHVGVASIKRAIIGARRALGEAGDSQLSIRTVRGFGYQFVGAVVRRGGALGYPLCTRALAESAPARFEWSACASF